MLKQTYEQFPSQLQRLGYSGAIKVGTTIYVAGTIAITDLESPLPESMEDQMRQVYHNIAATLAHFGANLGDIVDQTVYVTDLDAAMSAGHVRREIYVGKIPPASTLVEVRRLALGAKVEIKVVAQLSE